MKRKETLEVFEFLEENVSKKDGVTIFPLFTETKDGLVNLFHTYVKVELSNTFNRSTGEKVLYLDRDCETKIHTLKKKNKNGVYPLVFFYKDKTYETSITTIKPVLKDCKELHKEDFLENDEYLIEYSLSARASGYVNIEYIKSSLNNIITNGKDDIKMIPRSYLVEKHYGHYCLNVCCIIKEGKEERMKQLIFPMYKKYVPKAKKKLSE